MIEAKKQSPVATDNPFSSLDSAERLLNDSFSPEAECASLSSAVDPLAADVVFGDSGFLTATASCEDSPEESVTAEDEQPKSEPFLQSVVLADDEYCTDSCGSNDSHIQQDGPGLEVVQLDGFLGADARGSSCVSIGSLGAGSAPNSTM